MCVGGGAGGYFMLLFSMLFFFNSEINTNSLSCQTKFWKNIFIDNIFDANIFI